MGPRKKLKSNPTQPSRSTVAPCEDTTKRVLEQQIPRNPSQTARFSSAEGNVNKGGTSPDVQRPSSSRNSWYERTWPRVSKSSAITQIVKESVSAAGLSASEATAKIGQGVGNAFISKSSAATFARTFRATTTIASIDATATKTHATSTSSIQDPDPQAASPASLLPPDCSQKHEFSQVIEPQPTDLHLAKTRVKQKESCSRSKPFPPAPETSPGWLAWLSGTTPPVKENFDDAPVMHLKSVTSPLDQNTPPSETIQRLEDTICLPSEQKKRSDTAPVASISPAGQRRSWLTFWTQSSDAQVASDAQNLDQTSNAGEHVMGAEPTNPVSNVQDTEAQDGNLVSWGLWLRSKQHNGNDRAGKSPADENIATSLTTVTSEGMESIGFPKTARSKGATLDVPLAEQMVLPDLTSSSTSDVPKRNTARGSSSIVAIAKAVPSERYIQTPMTSLLSDPRNILLPQLKATFGSADASGWMQTFSRYFSQHKAPISKHVSFNHDKLRIRKAIAIGVHGYFPAPLIRTILGQPTGTSVKFADMAESAIQRWTKRHDYSCDIAKVALEGEGRVGDRVDILWKLMLNWLDDIRKADFVFVACHSQGVPVALMLVAKLISFGCIDGAHITVCAMAGVNLGPFPEYKSRWIGGAAGELFEFAKPESPVSCDYNTALRTALGFGVKIAYVGSIDDQLVSLEV